MNEADRAYEKALVYLEKRDRTEHEVRERLSKAGFSEDAVNDVVSRLKEYGYVDDEGYAVRYCEALTEKGRGRLRIAAEMRRKGLPEELVRNTLEDRTDVSSEYERALEEAMKTVALISPGTESRKAAEKINRRLASRGYTWETIGDVMNEVRKRLADGDKEEIDEGADNV